MAGLERKVGEWSKSPLNPLVNRYKVTSETIIYEDTLFGMMGELEEGLGESQTLIYDMSGVKHFSSSALAVLISTKKSAEQKNGNLVIAGASPEITEAFKITRLNKLFDMYSTFEQAERACA